MNIQYIKKLHLLSFNFFPKLNKSYIGIQCFDGENTQKISNFTLIIKKLFTGLWLLEQNDKKREKWTVIKQKTEIYLAKYFPKHTQINFNYQRGKIAYK